MTATVAVFDPALYLGKAFQLLVVHDLDQRRIASMLSGT